MDTINTDNTKPDRLTTLLLSKEQATNLKVDQSFRAEVVGTVQEIRPSFNDKETYEVVLKDSNVEFCDQEDKSESISEDKKDSLATMPKDELKKVIMVREVKE